MDALSSDQMITAIAEGVKDQNGSGCVTRVNNTTIRSTAGVRSVAAPCLNRQGCCDRTHMHRDNCLAEKGYWCSRKNSNAWIKFQNAESSFGNRMANHTQAMCDDYRGLCA